jgi:hypothetical protein
MPILDDWALSLDVDQVLRGQGADPDVIRERSPKLVNLAERALAEGSPSLRPRLMYQRASVDSVLHERLLLAGGSELRSKLLAQHLAGAQGIVISVCTVGPEIESMIGETLQANPALALALDGLGNAAVEELANQACKHFEDAARGKQLEASIPLSPGMQDWPVAEGQQQIFSLLDAQEIGVILNRSHLMSPSKSLSMVIGIGRQMAGGVRQCDFCVLNATCRYQDHYV